MPELSITRGFRDGEALLEADLDNIKNAVTTLVNTTLLDGDNLQNDIITADKIVADSVTTAVLGTGCVTTNKVNDLAVTTAKILDGEVSTRNLADSSVTTDKINDLAITSAKFSETARLSANKIEAKSVFVGSNASPTTATYGDPITTFVTTNITADTRYCLIILQPYNTTSSSVRFNVNGSGIGSGSLQIYFYHNGSLIGSRALGKGGDESASGESYIALPLSAFSIISGSSLSNGDTITASYFINRTTGSSTPTATISACKLYVIEL